MNQRQGTSGPQFRADRAVEQEAVRTTIVGGRPPGSGKNLGDVPRGIEVLVKKASVDPAFKKVLLEQRAEAAGQIGLKLDDAEVMMLTVVPGPQLETIIARTSVPQEHRRAFLGKTAAVMLAAVGLIGSGCDTDTKTKGIRPDRVQGIRPTKTPDKKTKTAAKSPD